MRDSLPRLPCSRAFSRKSELSLSPLLRYHERSKESELRARILEHEQGEP